MVGKLAITSCLLALRLFYQQLQYLGDSKAIILPWKEDNIDNYKAISQALALPITIAGISG